jgi:hypothetical protein
MVETAAIWLAAGQFTGRKCDDRRMMKLTISRKKITGWAGLIRVDEKVYQWMGAVPDVENVRQESVEYTSTRTIFKMKVGERLNMKITFLSPITPKDLKRMSLVFSYLQVEVSSADGREHDVQLYSDISAGRIIHRFET